MTKSTNIKDFLPYVYGALFGIFLLIRPPSQIFVFIGAIIVVITIIIYCKKIYSDTSRTDSDIDSVYYFGFVITIVTLVFTIINLAYDKNIVMNQTQIITQFGLGLAFTAVALVCRIFLLLAQSNKAQHDTEAAHALAKKVEELSGRFNTLSDNIGKLAENAQTGSVSLLKSFDEAENQFKEKTKLFNQLARAEAAAIKQANDELDASIKRAQTWKVHWDEVFKEATKKFRNDLDEAAKASLRNTGNTLDKASREFLANFATRLDEAAAMSLEKAAETIRQSNKQYSDAIAGLCKEIDLMQARLKTVDFKRAAKRIETFSSDIEAAFKGIQAAVDTTSLDTATAINALGDAVRNANAVASSIGANLEGLENLEQLIAKINQAADELDKLAKQTLASNGAIASLEGAAQGAAMAVGDLDRHAQGTSASLDQLSTSNSGLMETTNKLDKAAQVAHTLAQTATEGFKHLQAVEELASRAEQAGLDLQKASLGVRQSAEALGNLDRRVGQLEDLQKNHPVQLSPSESEPVRGNHT